MPPHQGFLLALRLDILFEVVSAAFSLTIAVLSLSASRRLGSKTLLQLGLGFLLISAAMLFRSISVAGLISIVWQLPRGAFFSQLFLTETLYSVLRIAGYIVFVHLYASYLGRTGEKASYMAQIIAIYNPAFETASAILLAFVVYRTGINWASGRRPSSWTVFLGFTSLLASHLLFTLTNISFTFYLAGHFAQLVSLSLFLLAVLLVRLNEKRV
ncbi:MAG: hypothetical protein QW756_01375 [Nitrososphaerota archaeon]